MHIAFDGTTLRPGRTGVGYYTEHLLRATAAQCGGDEITVISNRPIETASPLPAHVRHLVTFRRLPRFLWLQTQAPRLVRRIHADIVHFTNGMLPAASSVPTVVTIHDMSLTLFPRFHPTRRVLLNRPFVNLAARRADAIITVSETAKRDIVRLYGIDGARVHVVYEAAAPSFRVIHDPCELRRVRERYGLTDRFLLYVGTIEPRKNLPTLIEAFARRRVAGDLPHQLVCVGPYGWLSQDIETLIDTLHVRDAITFTGYVPFEDLPAIYNLAELFVFPSVYEGFGLPVVEAMACGTPVLTGHVAALSEVAGGAAEEVASLDVESLGDAIVALTRDRARREERARLGLERAHTFSWSRAASETLKVYRAAVASPVAARADTSAALQS
ncbi:MAG: glycosyltransferase family 1 protein [Vicinamibacterales bacterium]